MAIRDAPLGEHVSQAASCSPFPTHPAATTGHCGPPWAALSAVPQQTFCPFSNPFLNLLTLPPQCPCHPSLCPSETTSQQPQHATPIPVPQHRMSYSHFIHCLHCTTLGHVPAISPVSNPDFSVFPLKEADPLVPFGCPSLSHCILLPVQRLEPHTLPQRRVHQLQQQNGALCLVLTTSLRSHHFPGSLAATAHWAQVSREHSVVTPSTQLVAASCEFTTMWAWFRLFYPRHNLTWCTLKLMCHLSASFLFLAISFCFFYNFSTHPLLHVRNVFDAIHILSPQKPLVWSFALMLPEDPHHLCLQPYSTLSKSWWALDVAKLKMHPISERTSL